MEERVAELYNRFCFPKPEYIHFNPRAWSRIDHRLRRFAGVAASSPKNILVAGCGTTEALKYALNFPEAQVTAIDLSENSIALQKHFAASLGVLNISFQVLSLLQAGTLNRSFDFISSFGVVHHLEHPLEGLKALQGVLAPDGVMRLMFYNREHREPYRKIREAVLAAASGGTSWDARLDVTRKVLSQIASFPNRISRQARENLDHMAANLPIVADTILHPQESDYDVPELAALVGDAGLKFLCFENGWEWDLRRYFHTEDRGIFETLSSVQKFSLINGMVAPFFTFYASHPSLGQNADRSSWRDALLIPAEEQAHVIREDGTIGEKIGVTSQIVHERGAVHPVLIFGKKKVQLTDAFRKLIDTVKKPTAMREIFPDALIDESDPLFIPLQELIYMVEYFEVVEKGNSLIAPNCP